MRGSLELVPGSAKRSLPTECAAGRTRRRTHLRVLEPERQPERSTAPGQATEAERVVERGGVSDFGSVPRPRASPPRPRDLWSAWCYPTSAPAPRGGVNQKRPPVKPPVTM